MSRFRLYAAVHLFMVQESKVLLMRRQNTDYANGFFSVPAGHLDGNERATIGAVREAREETGVWISPNDLEMVHVMHRRDGGAHNERLDFFFYATAWAGTPRIMEPDKCDDMLWAPFVDLPPNTVPYVVSAIRSVESGQYYSEYGWV